MTGSADHTAHFPIEQWAVIYRMYSKIVFENDALHERLFQNLDEENTTGHSMEIIATEDIQGENSDHVIPTPKYITIAIMSTSLLLLSIVGVSCIRFKNNTDWIFACLFLMVQVFVAVAVFHESITGIFKWHQLRLVDHLSWLLPVLQIVGGGFATIVVLLIIGHPAEYLTHRSGKLHEADNLACFLGVIVSIFCVEAVLSLILLWRYVKFRIHCGGIHGIIRFRDSVLKWFEYVLTFVHMLMMSVLFALCVRFAVPSIIIELGIMIASLVASYLHLLYGEVNATTNVAHICYCLYIARILWFTYMVLLGRGDQC